MVWWGRDCEIGLGLINIAGGVVEDRVAWNSGVDLEVSTIQCWMKFVELVESFSVVFQSFGLYFGKGWDLGYLGLLLGDEEETVAHAVECAFWLLSWNEGKLNFWRDASAFYNRAFVAKQ